jgi:polyisoprenoid-binding protein YceI
MNKIVVNILAIVVIIVIIIGGYIFIKNKQIKTSLEGVEQAEFVDGTGVQNTNPVASEISIVRTNGEWSVSETGRSISETGPYTIDPSSIKFEFTGYKIGGQHVGTFNEINSQIALDEDGMPIILGMLLSPVSIKTDSEGVDKHLQAPEFFDTEKFSDIRVVVKGVEVESLVSIKAITDITIKGVTKTIAVPVTLSPVEGGTRFDVDTKIKISEWSMSYGPVLDDVRIVASAVLKTK